MEEQSVRTLSSRAPASAPARRLAAFIVLGALAAGCLGRHAGPRALAAVGAVAIGAGSLSWSAGERLEGGQHGDVSGVAVEGGFVSVALGLVAVVAAGGWMAATVGCEGDPDCGEDEICREVPAPPGGVPYKQCVPRG